MIATFTVQPLDLVKTRMQMSGEGGSTKAHVSTLQVIRAIVAREGFFKLYAGLSAALLRQATYTTTRLGIYTGLFEHFSPAFTTVEEDRPDGCMVYTDLRGDREVALGP
ncbi:unnamed protein product [Schistocephalus solidus]|uniref:Mitochondrial uncoupling protein 3 n=1 Tax=Schistocephalus solidus TaxID=70667 RepID=A0A183SEH6_SCHSO|nr:unnamed protein product [Schistocephalus solidus]